MIVRGHPVSVPFDVRTWHTTGLGFPGLSMRSGTSSVGLHWTGGEGGPTQVHTVLNARRLSVHFFIDYAGVVYQFCDASARAAHIGTENARCIGVEIANRASAKPDPKHPREMYTDTVQGKTFRASYFTFWQVESARALTTALCSAYGLPYASPASSKVLPPADLRAFRGVLGHFHATKRKVDPGTRLFRDIGLQPTESCGGVDV